MGIAQNKVRVVLRVSGSEVDIHKLPSTFLSIGLITSRPKGVPESVLPDAWWWVEVENFDQESTEPAIQSLLLTVEPVLNELCEVCSCYRFNVEVDCTIEIDQSCPVIEVSKNSLAQLSRLNAALGFEVQDYRE